MGPTRPRSVCGGTDDALAGLLPRGVDFVKIKFHGCAEAAVPLSVRKHRMRGVCEDNEETTSVAKLSKGASAWSHVRIDDDGAGGEEPCCMEFWLRNFAAVPSGNATGGHLWSAGVQLARVLFAARAKLTGKRIIELGCGLGLPSLVAAPFAARVAATDSEVSLAENLTFNVEANAADVAKRLSALVLDFTSARELHAAGLSSWDVVLFADAIYNGQCGIALPHVIRALLDGKAEQPLCLGAFPHIKRAGEDRFWQEVPRAGLRATELLTATWSRIYAFEPVDSCPSKVVEDVLHACGTDGCCSESDAEEVMPLFDDIINANINVNINASLA